MASATPRVTGGRPATMTRSAVQQARTQVRQSAAVAIVPPVEAASDDGWVSVDHRRRHRQPSESDTKATAIPAAKDEKANASRTSPTSSAPREPRDVRRAASKEEETKAKSNLNRDAAAKDEALLARSNSRADALSAAVTMDKKARERMYHSESMGPVTSPPPSSPTGSNSGWGSPPPPSRLMGRSKSSSPDSQVPVLDRESSLQRLMMSWKTVDEAQEQATTASTNARTPGSRQQKNEGRANKSNKSRDSNSDAPPVVGLRRSQSDATQSSASNKVRSPTAGIRSLTCVTDSKNGSSNAVSVTGTTPNGNGQAKKCGDKRDFFFRNLEFETRNMLQIDEVASFSVTDFEMARKISQAIVQLFPEFLIRLDGDVRREDEPRKYPLVITDATACVGGNVLSFCDYFQFVYAIECDLTRVAMLENNLRVLKKTNAMCLCASYLDVLYDFEQDVVFIDPPWGGPEYKDQDKVDLFLGDAPLYDICERLRGHAKCVVLKVPTNFDDEKFAARVSGLVTVRRDFKKMHLVVLDFRDESLR